ncbi:uncharacterized protein BYT42DRAFT_551858 [Radiomyces spectabilis]|uniref:uncharacterized protein n=1 Tax=Radiomyces spectabilis TaxID=64574 RepID=UPI00221F67B3|nr:uncharacterized protein BYT42DRAFT_551858 [Radiomyces spectabilis]KAI8393673.1 hypothetical protein BYT42DRAFT_551858 [Radiomyces spectabilis]
MHGETPTDEWHIEEKQLAPALSQITFRFSDDFSSLADHLAQFSIDYQQMHATTDQQEEEPKRDVQIHADPVIRIFADRETSDTEESQSTIDTPGMSPKTVPRNTSCKFIPLRRRKEHNAQQPMQYHARSYTEMMRITDTKERIAFYERTCDQCLHAESKLSSWIKRQKEKGLPTPLTEGYQPPPRLPCEETPVSIRSSHFANMSRSFSGSVSMIWRKASKNGLSDPLRPRDQKGLFSGSSSRLSLARAAHPPRVSPAYIKPFHDIQRLPVKSKSTSSGLTPLNMSLLHRNYSLQSASPLSATLHTPHSYSSLRSRSSTQSIRERYYTPTTSTNPLEEMCIALPHIHRSVLQGYLAEANGDPMLGITLAVRQLKTISSSTSRQSIPIQ